MKTPSATAVVLVLLFLISGVSLFLINYYGSTRLGYHNVWISLGIAFSPVLAIAIARLIDRVKDSRNDRRRAK